MYMDTGENQRQSCERTIVCSYRRECVGCRGEGETDEVCVRVLGWGWGWGGVGWG